MTDRVKLKGRNENVARTKHIDILYHRHQIRLTCSSLKTKHVTHIA